VSFATITLCVASRMFVVVVVVVVFVIVVVVVVYFVMDSVRKILDTPSYFLEQIPKLIVTQVIKKFSSF
jgi:hypothetical protein